MWIDVASTLPALCGPSGASNEAPAETARLRAAYRGGLSRRWRPAPPPPAAEAGGSPRGDRDGRARGPATRAHRTGGIPRLMAIQVGRTPWRRSGLGFRRSCGATGGHAYDTARRRCPLAARGPGNSNHVDARV